MIPPLGGVMEQRTHLLDDEYPVSPVLHLFLGLYALVRCGPAQLALRGPDGYYIEAAVVLSMVSCRPPLFLSPPSIWPLCSPGSSNGGSVTADCQS